MNKPVIFIKKLQNNYKTIPLNTTVNTVGLTRYFPPTTKEWVNSIYAYNHNSIKNLSIADKNLSKILKSYFNMYFNKTVLKTKHISTRFRRLRVDRVFISKAELKHTSSKVVITLHVYNEEKRILINKIKALECLLFPSIKLLSDKVNKGRPLSLKEKLILINRQEENISFFDRLKDIKLSIIEKIKKDKNILLTTKNLKRKKTLLLNIDNLIKDLNNISNIIATCENDPTVYEYYNDRYLYFINKKQIEKEISTIAHYKLLLALNKSKFEDKFFFKLKPLISKIYNKEVEFNVVNLKTLCLNSDIFTQVISLKLKNRNNRLLNVLRSSLYMVKSPKVNLIREKFNNKIKIKELWVNRVKNIKISSVFNNNNKDTLNQLLLDIFPNSVFIKGLSQDSSKFLNNENLLNNVLNSLKYKKMAGIRLEAKGRLTKRLTASRSLFKIKWKGSLKNIDASYRGLSSVMIRGYAKSNVQYSIVNSKTRNGAFGLKGWISSK